MKNIWEIVENVFCFVWIVLLIVQFYQLVRNRRRRAKALEMIAKIEANGGSLSSISIDELEEILALLASGN